MVNAIILYYNTIILFYVLKLLLLSFIKLKQLFYCNNFNLKK